MFDEKLEVLKKQFFEYVELVESMLKKSIEALFKKENSIAKELIEIDEPKADEFEIYIDESCFTIIAQFSPKGVNLRTILMILKMNNDLERIADHAVNIAESVLKLKRVELLPEELLNDLKKMYDEANKMYKRSMEAFVSSDPSLAIKICQHDEVVDTLRDESFKKISDFIKSGTVAELDDLLHLRRIIGNLERIADLSTNIAEEMVYILEGKIIKHRSY